MYNYQENAARETAEREREVYLRFLAQYRQLLYAAEEGVFEVSVRSQSGQVVIPVSLMDGVSLTHYLIDAFTTRIDRIESNLNTTVVNVGEETQDELGKVARAKKQRDEDIRRGQEEYAAQVGQLAQQTQVTQKPAGRPRKAAVAQPSVMQAVGIAASGVPMNQTRNQPQG